MAKPKSAYSGLVNTSPNGSGMSGSRTVAQAVARARTSINPHAGFYDFSPRQYLPDDDMYGATDVVEQRLPSGPNYGPPGFGDPSLGTEYGAIPNRGRMMREIDVMMGLRSGGGRPPMVVAANNQGPANQYSPSGYGGQRGVGAGGQLPNTGMSYGNPSMYGIGPESGNGPGAGMGGTYGQRPELPYEARAREAAAKNIPWVDGPAGVDVGIGSSDPNLIGSIPWVDGPAGVDVGIGADFPAYNYVPWDPAGNGTDVGMGGELLPQNTDFRGPPGNPLAPINSRAELMEDIDNMMERGALMSELDRMIPDQEGGTATYRNMYRGGGPEDATRDDMGPLANNLERTMVDYDISRENKNRLDKKEQEAAAKVAEEWKERYGLDDDAAKREAEAIEKIQAIYKKQRIFMVLSALSGDPNIAKIAGMIAEQDIDILEREYGTETNQRMRDMQKAILFDKDGNYDPPESQEEMYRALGTMGATPKEMEAITGQFDFKEDEAKGQNWWNEEQQRYEWTNTGKPPPGGGWVESGDVSKTKDSEKGTGTKGAQAQELIDYQNAIRDADALGNTELAERLRNDYDVKRQLYGLTNNAQSKDPTKSTTMLNNKWEGILGNVTNSFTKEVDWKALSEEPPKGLGFPPPGGGAWTAQKFYDWFDQTYITESINNQVQQDPNNGVQDPGEMSREEARLWLIENNEGITEDEIEAELNSAGY